MKKRIVALFLSVIIVIGIIPAQAFSANTEGQLDPSYTVSFISNGDNVVNMPEPQLIEVGQKANMPLPPYRDGYVFLGWYLSEEVETLGEVFDFANTPINGDTTLYAIWGNVSEDDDSDGLPNSVEGQLGTNATAADTDYDGLNDYIEVVSLDTDPLSYDSNNDGVSDFAEDCDNDGISNGEEINMGTSPSSADSDYDGLNDYEEMTVGSNPMNEDTDGDGVVDGLEVEYSYDPLVFNDHFVDISSSQPFSENFPVSARVNAEVSASVLGSVAINPLTSTDNPCISKTIPGYMGHAFELSASGDIISAILTFEYDTTIWQRSNIFQPRVYQFNEATQALDELQNQDVRDGAVSVSVDTCGTYILLNKYEYDAIKGNYEVSSSGRTFTSMSQGGDAVTTSSNSYSDYYASYADELRALVTNGDTTDINADGIYDKYNIYIFLGLIPTVAGAKTFVGYDFSESQDYDNDGLLNGDEIKIVIVNGLPQIEVISYPMLEDSDFDGIDDNIEYENGSDPLRHSYYSYYIDCLLDDSRYEAAKMVAEIESDFEKEGQLDFLTLLGYVQYGSLETIFKREWLTYLNDYYDNRNGHILLDSSNKYQREYWIDAGYTAWEATANIVAEELATFSDEIIKDSIKNASKDVIKNAKMELARLVNLRDTTTISYFHVLGEDWDIEVGECAERLDEMVRTISDCTDSIDSLNMDIKYVQTIDNVIEITTTTLDVLSIVLDEARDLYEVFDLLSQVNANLEAYADSCEIFWYIYQNHPEEKARNAAWDIYYALKTEADLLNLKYLEVCETFAQVGVATIIVGLEGLLNLNPIVSVLYNYLKLVVGIATAIANQNNLIIANDILGDAVEDLTLTRLEKVGTSSTYSPYNQEDKLITDRYLTNLIQLRLVGEMKVNNYIVHKIFGDFQDEYNERVKTLTDYAEKLHIPLSESLLLQCALTVTPNVTIRVDEYVSAQECPPEGDIIGYYWRSAPSYTVSIDGYQIDDINGIKLLPGEHVLCASTIRTEPCYYYFELKDEDETYELSFELVPKNIDHPLISSINNTITGYSREGGLGSVIGGVTIKFREGLNNKTGDVISSVTTDDGGKYSIELPNGYYTAEFSKDGYDTGYVDFVAYLGEHECSCEIFKSTPTQRYYITYDANKGEGAPSPQENTEGDTVLSSQIPTRTGYTFLGWDENPNADEPTYRYEAGKSMVLKKEGDVTLYAIWDPVTFDIIFHADGGYFDGDPNKDTVSKPKQYGQAFYIDVSKPDGKPGYEFAGQWYDKYKGKYYAHDPNVPIYDIGDSTTNAKHLYAVWNRVAYLVAYDYNNGSPIDPKDIDTVPFADAMYYAPRAPKVNGESFKGWMYQNPNGEYWWASNNTDNGKVSVVQPGEPLELTEELVQLVDERDYDLVLYAKWVYYVHYNNNDSVSHDVVPDGKGYVIKAPLSTEDGKIFKGWKYVNSNGEEDTYQVGETIDLTEDLSLVAVWGTKDTDGVILSTTTDQTSYKPGDTAKINITVENSSYFRVDASDSDGFKLKGVDGKKASEAVFVENHSQSDEDDLKCYNNGTTYTLEVYIPDHCEDGVYPIHITVSNGVYSAAVDGSVSGTETDTASETVMIKIDTREEDSEYFVLNYHPNDGYGSVPDSVQFKLGDYVVIASGSSLEREGYTFEGWSMKENGSGKVYKVGKEYQFTKDTTLYAIWEEDPDYDTPDELELFISDEGYSLKTGVSWYKPGDVIGLRISIDNSDHVYVDARKGPGFTFTHANGHRTTEGTFYEKSSPDYDGVQTTYTNGSAFYVSITIPEDCPDGEYTIIVKGAQDPIDKSTGSSYGNILTKGVTITVRASEAPDELVLNKSEVTIHKGDDGRLKASTIPAYVIEGYYKGAMHRRYVSWQNSNSKVVDIDEGGNELDFTAKKEGTAIITATLDGVSAICEITVVRCDYCEKIIDLEYLASPATCIEQATYYYVCSCGNVGSETYKAGSLKDHAYSDWVTVTEPGEYTVGLKERTCSGCGDVESEVIPAIGHIHTFSSEWSYDARSHWHAATCEHTEKVSDFAEHIYDDAEDQNCNVCGYTGNVCDEHIEEIIPSKDATCTEDGLAEGMKCSICGEILVEQEVIPATGHIDENGDYICDNCSETLDNEYAQVSFTSASAMCGENVTITVSINNCVDARSILITPQYDEDLLEIVSGTWLMEGLVTDDWSSEFGDAAILFSANTDVNTDIFEFVFRVKDDAQAGQVANVSCKIIITTTEENEDIPVSVTITAGYVTVLAKQCSHSEETIPTVAPTCTEDGLTEGKQCAICGEILIAQEVIPALGHEFDEGVVTTEPTCTETGFITYTCLREGCDHSYTEVIPAKDHTYTTWMHDDENHWHECSTCGETLDMVAHEWEEVYRWESCREPGGVIYGCTVCLHEIIVELPQAPHTEVIIPAVPATCTEFGWTEGMMCAECGEILVAQEVIPATGHIDDNGDDICDTCGKNLCTPKIVFASQSVTSGQTITVEITAVNMPAVKSLMLENFQYDSDMLEFVDAELNLGDAVIADWDSTDMIATVAFDENTDINGTILTLTFKVKDGVEGECSMTCDVYVNQMQADGNETQVELSVVPGTIVVMSCKRGDVNGDGYVNSNDAIYLLRYTLSPNRYPINQSGDMNGDGYVNSNDAIYLLRHTLTPNRYPLA